MSSRLLARGLRRSAVWVALAACGCNLPDESALGQGRPKIPAPPTAPPTGRVKIEMPPPMPPPPKPDGQPQGPQDLRKLAESAAAGTPVQRPGAPPIVRLDDHRLKIGDTLVDRTARRIEIPARVNMVQGILEYFACQTGGKLHESVVEQLDRPSHLHLALLLLGLEPTESVPDDKLGNRIIRMGSKLRIYVEWNDVKTGAAKRLPAEGWLYSRKRKGPPKAADWVFQGSAFWNGDYSADSAKSVIGLIPDPTTVVGVIGNEGNPYQGMEGFEVNTAAIPPNGTPLKLVIEAPPTAP